MKKLIYIFSMLSTFTIAVSAFYLRPLFLPVSLVTISPNVKLYYFNEVKITAYLEAPLNRDSCCSVFDLQNAYIEGAGVELTEELEKNENLRHLREELLLKRLELGDVNFDKGDFVAEVVITGKIRKGMGCFASPLYIEATEIKQVSPIKFISREEFKKYGLVNHE